MAIELGTESLTLSVKERTWRVEIFTDVGIDPIVTAHREKVWLRPDGTVADRVVLPSVRRTLSQVQAEEVTYLDQTVTCAVLAGLIAAAADVFATEDATPPAE